jgi:hypothetical protein
MLQLYPEMLQLYPEILQLYPEMLQLYPEMLQLYPEIPNAQSWTFLFCIGDSNRYFKGLWSVLIMNLTPCR